MFMLNLVVFGTEYFDEETETFETVGSFRIEVRAFSDLPVKMGVKTSKAVSYVLAVKTSSRNFMIM